MPVDTKVAIAIGVGAGAVIYLFRKTIASAMPYGSAVKTVLEPTEPIPPMQKMDLSIQRKFDELPQKGKVQAEYVWIGGNNELRCKTKTLTSAPKSVADLPIWNFDGSSTEQAPGSDSEVLLKPAAIYSDPFRPGGGQNILVVCDCCTLRPRSNTALFDRGRV